VAAEDGRRSVVGGGGGDEPLYFSRVRCREGEGVASESSRRFGIEVLGRIVAGHQDSPSLDVREGV